MALNTAQLAEEVAFAQTMHAAKKAEPEPVAMVDESPLVLRIRAAVTQRVEPFEVVVEEIERGARVIVGVVGIKEVFGYRLLMPDGRRNLHTPESFADEVAIRVQGHVGRVLEAQAKRERRAAKRFTQGKQQAQGR